MGARSGVGEFPSKRDGEVGSCGESGFWRTVGRTGRRFGRDSGGRGRDSRGEDAGLMG